LSRKIFQDFGIDIRPVSTDIRVHTEQELAQMSYRIATIVLNALTLMDQHDTDGHGRTLTNDEATVRTVGLDVARLEGVERTLTDAEWFAVRIAVTSYFAGRQSPHGPLTEPQPANVQEQRNWRVLIGGASRDGGVPDDGLADDQIDSTEDVWARHASVMRAERNAGGAAWGTPG
jgi:hypothetical protein